MRSFAAVLAVAGVAVAHGPGGWPASAGWGAPSYVTDVVTAYTTYCPEATHITHGSKTYTVTEATTLTISDCPCTVTRPVASSTAPAPKPPVASSSAGPAPVPVVSASTSYSMPAPSASATTSAPASTYTGAASKVQVAGGLLAALGLVAAAL